MKKIAARSTDSTISTGAVAQKDLKRYGYIEVEFFITDKKIWVDVAGFSSVHSYIINPKSKKQERANKYFIEKFVDKCDSPLLKSQLGI